MIDKDCISLLLLVGSVHLGESTQRPRKAVKFIRKIKRGRKKLRRKSIPPTIRICTNLCVCVHIQIKREKKTTNEKKTTHDLFQFVKS